MPPRNGQLSRADLLEALLKADVEDAQAIAKQLGLQPVPRRLPDTGDSEVVGDSADAHADNTSRQSEDNKVQIQLPREPFWLCVEREILQAKELPRPDPQAVAQSLAWPNRPSKPPLWFLLNSFREVLPRLLTQLASVFPGRELDVEPMVKAISRGRHLRRLPRKQRRTLGQQIQFIDDRHSHLTTFWRDQQLMQAGLAHFLADYGYSSAVLSDGASRPRSLIERQLQDWQRPAAGSVAFILSDLGALSTQSRQIVTRWLEIVQQLKRQHCKIIALVPCHPDDCDSRFKRLVAIVPWLPTRQFPARIAAQWERQTEVLLTLLAPAIRLEPGLIRQMRLEYSAIKPDDPMPPVIEACLWQHPAIAEHHSTAASWHVESRLQYLAQFAELDTGQRQRALHIIRQWRGRLSEQVWFEEIIELDRVSQALFKDDLKAAIAYFKQMEGDYRVDPERLSEADQSWLRRLLQRLPQHVLQHELIGEYFQRFKYALYDGEEIEHIDPRQLPPDKPIRQVELCQHGHTLCLLAFDAQQSRPVGFSPLCLFSLRHPHVQIQQNGERLGEIGFGQEAAFSLAGLEGFELLSDCERLVFQPWYRPDEIMSAGQDQFGLFVDVLLALPQSASARSQREQEQLLTQRFRYIPPQTFLMGSPEDEPGRYDRETQHEVILTQGYWLADTTVTQALWEAVMGENPSRFKGEQNPVESISWEDTQGFIQKLKASWPLLDIRLPSEAEWECACRAGTTTAFSFGGKDDLDTTKVNYSGKWDDYDFEGETKPVKSYTPNLWGLYEMHGNVYEWCQDKWQEELGAEPVVLDSASLEKESEAPDKLEKDKSEQGQRVLRGGSWNDDGRLCRSAYRGRYAPGNRNLNVGCRLALGHLSSSPEPGTSSLVASSGRRVA